MGTQEEGEQRKGAISYATLGVDTSWGLICSEMVISDPIGGVTHMPSDWKLQSGLPVSRWRRANSVFFKSTFCLLTRLRRYACSLEKTESVKQVGGKGKKKKN